MALTFRTSPRTFKSGKRKWVLTLVDAPAFTSVKDIQGELIAEGYDLGPTGADGKYGPKTREAILTFQGLHGLVVDGIVGPKTRKALVAEWLRRN